jgi:hypothetical protein
LPLRRAVDPTDERSVQRRPSAPTSCLRTRRNFMRSLVASALLASVALVGCQSVTDPLGRQESLEASQKQYTDFVRWGELERASKFVDPELRDSFLDQLPRFDLLRVTDFDVQDIEYDGEDEVHVVVTYHGFSLKNMVERRFREEQTWVRDPGLRNRWRVTTDLADVLSDLRSGS